MERCITTKKQKHMNFPTCDAGMQRAFSLPLKCWWSDTDKVNPLGMAEPGGNKPFVWRGAGVWARFWEACSKSTRPFTRTAEQVADAERRSKQPRRGETYEVEKVSIGASLTCGFHGMECSGPLKQLHKEVVTKIRIEGCAGQGLRKAEPGLFWHLTQMRVTTLFSCDAVFLVSLGCNRWVAVLSL
eukprot:scaffold6049_cov16-Tisochrysis_lutea.AAC.1